MRASPSIDNLGHGCGCCEQCFGDTAVGVGDLRWFPALVCHGPKLREQHALMDDVRHHRIHRLVKCRSEIAGAFDNAPLAADQRDGGEVVLGIADDKDEPDASKRWNGLPKMGSFNGLQADAYAGSNELYAPERQPGRVT